MRKGVLFLLSILLLGGSVSADGSGKTSCGVESITGVSVTDGAVWHIGYGSQDVRPTFAALTDCSADTSSVTFSLDGSPIGVTNTANAGGLFTVAGPALGTLSTGSHALTVEATSATNAEVSIAPVTVHFTVVRHIASADANGNGIPDDSFATLTLGGDAWIASTTVDDTGARRLTGMVRWDGAASAPEGHAVVALSNPDNPMLRVSVMAPNPLLEADEVGILLVQAAPDLVTLLGPVEAELIGREPALLLPNASYVDVSILVSRDGGGHYAEIDPARLADHPVHLAIEGANVAGAAEPAFYEYPTSVIADGKVGDRVIAWSGDWSQDGIVRTTTRPSSIEADLSALSVFAPVDEAGDAPLIDVVLPTAGESYSFGEVETGQYREEMFVVQNAGGGTLTGKASVSEPFEITSGALYQLAAGESQGVVVRFTPTEAKAYQARLSFSGGGGSGIAVTGTGLTSDSSCNLTAGALAASPPPPGGDGFLLAVCAAAMMLAGRRFAFRRSRC